MFLKKRSMTLCIVGAFSGFILLEVCTQKDTALSLPQNSTVSPTSKAPTARQTEILNTGGGCESYLATSEYKICVPQGVSSDNKGKELSASVILSKEREP